MLIMEIVIKIPDKVYKFVQNTSFVENENTLFKQTSDERLKTLFLFDILDAIKDGTPLPKHHGDLVDRDDINCKFYDIWKELESYSNKPSYKELLDRWSMCMDTALTIIEGSES